MSQCPECKAELPEKARFCGVCGYRLRTTEMVALASTQAKEGVPNTPQTGSTGVPIPSRTVRPNTRKVPPSDPPSSNILLPAPSTLPTTPLPSDTPDPQAGDGQPALSTLPTTPLPPGITDSTLQTDKEHNEQSVGSDQPIQSGQVSQPSQAEQVEQAGPPRQPASPPAGLVRPVGPKSSSTQRSSSPPIPGRPRTSPLQPPQPPATPSAFSGPSVSGATLPQTPPSAQPGTPSAVPATGHTQNRSASAGQQPQQVPVPPMQQLQPSWSETPSAQSREQIVRTSTAPLRRSSDSPVNNSAFPAGVSTGQPGNTAAGQSAESFVATSKAAERWRISWRNRQRSEAGPATNVSRGQASVSEPLLAMQHSLARMRAILLPKKVRQARIKDLKFWVAIGLMVCLIVGLSAYLISTYLPNPSLGAIKLTHSGDTQQPTLAISGAQGTAIKPGQTVYLHGAHFGAGDSITFLLDTTTPINDTHGKPLVAQTNGQGSFDVTLTIDPSWSFGNHLIQAEDGHTGQSAYLSIQVGFDGTATTTSPNLALTIDDQSVDKLTFQGVAGQANPNNKSLQLTNTSHMKLEWTATAITNDNLSWLVVDRAAGSLNIAQTDTIGVGVLIAGLQSRTAPYTGEVVFTINQKEQLSLPVTLKINDSNAEMVFTPNPIIAAAAGNTCQPTTLTLINIGSAYIRWAVVPDVPIQDHIHIQDNGIPTTQGDLAPSGQSGDTQKLTLTCTDVHPGDKPYHITVSANNAHWDAYVYIQ